MKYPFAYTVMTWTDYDNGINHYKYESGMCIADSFMGAVRILDEYYGDDLIAIKHLELFEDSSVIILPEDWIRQYVHKYWSETDIAYDTFGMPIAPPAGKSSPVVSSPIEIPDCGDDLNV
jgi:hypothetical protein